MKKLTADTTAIITAIEGATASAKSTSDLVSRELVHHTKQDDERFAALTALVESIATDVKSLLASRSFMRGAWKAITVSAVVASATVSAIHAYWGTFLTFLKGH